MIPVSENQVIYSGNGVNTAFSYSFKIIESTDLHLIRVAADGTETEVTSDYYVDMAASKVYYPGYAPGVEEAEADQPQVLQTGEKLVVYRNVPITQQDDMPDQWPFDVIESALDKSCIIDQQLKGDIDRALKFSRAVGSNFNPTFPIVAGKTIRIKNDGSGFETTDDPAVVRTEVVALKNETVTAKNAAEAAQANAEAAASTAAATAATTAVTNVQSQLAQNLADTNAAKTAAQTASSSAQSALSSAQNAASEAETWARVAETTVFPNGVVTEAKLADSLKPYVMKDYVTPEMYYQASDGEDWGKTINRALASGKPVIMDAKTYNISTSIVLPTSARLFGKGIRKTFIKNNGTDYAIKFDNSFYAVICDFAINGTITNATDNTGATSYGISFEGARSMGTIVRNVYILYCSKCLSITTSTGYNYFYQLYCVPFGRNSIAVEIGKDTWTETFLPNYIYFTNCNFGNANDFQLYGATGLNLRCFQYVYLDKCDIVGFDKAINITGSSNVNSRALSITNCEFFADFTALNVADNRATTENVTIQNCRVTVQVNTFKFIKCSSTSNKYINNLYIDNIIIMNCGASLDSVMWEMQYLYKPHIDNIKSSYSDSLTFSQTSSNIAGADMPRVKPARFTATSTATSYDLYPASPLPSAYPVVNKTSTSTTYTIAQNGNAWKLNNVTGQYGVFVS